VATLPKVIRNPSRKRRMNPGSHSERLTKAMDFYKDFHWGEEPDRAVRRPVSPPPAVAVKLGKLDAVTYETVKAGERALYEHNFGEEGGKRPDLVMDAETKRLHIVGGDYDVRPEGIVD
jgi:hypothetical protein